MHYLQQLLVKNRYPVATDGFFGKKNEQAVIKFKKQNKIAVDGIVDPQNRNLLGACDAGGC